MSDSQIEYVRRLGEMHDLMEQVLDLQKDAEPTSETVSRIREIVQRSECLVENAHRASEMMIDGQILSTSGRIVRQHVQHYDSNLKSFNPEEYTTGLNAFFDNQDWNSEDKWDLLSEYTYGMFHKVPCLNYRMGTFKLDPPPPPEKEKTQRQKKTAEAKKNIISAEEQKDETDAPEMADEIYKHILRCLLRSYKKNNKQPIEYLRFVLDPNNYWKTSQNIFHLSFLVRDNTVKMTQNNDGLPMIEPVLDKEKGSRVSKSNQFIARITPYEWKNFVKLLEIKTPAIS